MAIYDSNEDFTVNDVISRVDRLMYENKWEQKRQESKIIKN